MASRGYIANKERESREDIANKDRQANIENSKRSARATILGAAIKSAPTAMKLLQDPSWYNKWLNTELFTGIPKFRASQVVQPRIAPVAAQLASGLTVSSTETSDPYVMALEYCSKIGQIPVATGASNYVKYPANAMWVKVLNELAKVNSRSVNQDSDVLGLYVLAVSEIVKFLGWIKTNLEIVNTFNEEQGQLRDALLLARVGGSSTTRTLFINEMAQIKKMYDMYVKRFNEELPLMSDMSIVARRWWVSCAVIKEHDTSKAQYITFYPRSVLRINDDASGLTRVTVAVSSVAQLESILDSMFTKISTDVDMQTLIGNIRAAVPEGKFFRVSEELAPELQFIDADHNALHQFHNLNTLPQDIYEHLSALSVSSFEGVSSDGETLSQGDNLTADTFATKSTFDSATLAYAENHLAASRAEQALDFYTDDVSSDLINESSRLHHIAQVNGTTKTVDNYQQWQDLTYGILSCGTEFIYRANVYTWDPTNKAFAVSYYYSYQNLGLITQGMTADQILAAVYNGVKYLGNISRFDWMFKITWCMPTSNVDNGAQRNTFGQRSWEINRLVGISEVDMSKVNQMCLMSLYYTNPNDLSKKIIR